MADHPGPEPRLLPLRNLLEAWEADAEAAHQAHRTGAPRGPLTGLSSLDRELGGALCPGLHIVHGAPGTGKTALALQIAAAAACPAVFVSAEMGPLELLRRLTSRHTETYLGKFKSGELLPSASLDYARRTVAACPGLALVDSTQAWASTTWLMDRAEAVRGESPHLLLVVDSIHSWAEGMPGGLPEYEALNAGLAKLRSLSAALGCAVLVVAERNRASMEKGGQSAGAGTRKLEYGSESVWDLTRKRDDPLDAGGEVPVTLRLEKNRHGTPGKAIELRFHGGFQRFREA